MFENTPVEFRTLIKKAWGDDAKSRPSAAQIACVSVSYTHLTLPTILLV